ncbi:hypothetical protein LCGC14_0343430 [marine sediment metagenome]|uniref:Uncharacterized protein n=1 Tax=marine sediment metagenome TaxID=412755 RepID=A0A0F9TCY3_9ZZZZ
MVIYKGRPLHEFSRWELLSFAENMASMHMLRQDIVDRLEADGIDLVADDVDEKAFKHFSKSIKCLRSLKSE